GREGRGGVLRGREEGDTARLPRHRAAPAGPRPHEAHLPPRRPRLPAHGCQRRGGEGDSGVSLPLWSAVSHHRLCFLVWSAAIYRRFCFVWRPSQRRERDESAAEVYALQTHLLECGDLSQLSFCLSSIRTARVKARPK